MLAPVFHQELVTSARRARYFLWRVLYAGLLLIVMLFVYLISYAMEEEWSYQIGSTFARQYLQSFAVLQLAAVMLLGPAVSAGAIARERERRTIEYLFTTHLTSVQIVLEKLAAAISQLSLAVLAGVPVLAIAMLLGGITSEELFDVSLITFSTLVAVTSVSLAASTICRRAREAVSVTYGLLFALMLGPVLLSGLTRGSMLAGTAVQISEAVQSVNPLSVLVLVLDTGSQPAAVRSALSWMCGVHLAVSFMLVAICAWGLRRVALHTGAPFRPRAQTRRWSRLHVDLGSRPLIWKEMFASRNHSRLARVGRGFLGVVMALAMLGTLWQFIDCALRDRWSQFAGFAMFMATVLASISILLAAAWASNTIATERERETWVMLISTPLEAREILFGKLAGSLYAARLTLLPVGFVWLLAAVAEPRLIPSIPFTLVGLAAAAIGLSMLGMMFSFWCANATRALGATLACVFTATVLGTCCMMPLGVFNPLYLLLFPAVANQMLMEAPSSLSWPMAIFALVYGIVWVVGVAVYLGGAWALWAICVANFDRLSGRIDLKLRSMPAPQPQPAAIQ